ncbi:LOW QUALITY PROTEIN: hypothetical protein PanWU01x14_169650 [Parasponia andersonii]|uniref:Uncharacterized protein n=1 Tax=Parasponia andersonii TaxID=3476 RepID=A0A2P5CAK7_PARAD|nr:LOW QUALITY PROTEIN: hypothetical protein PanWU01x14_169650 [Parasponia andersonii]
MIRHDSLHSLSIFQYGKISPKIHCHVYITRSRCLQIPS